MQRKILCSLGAICALLLGFSAQAEAKRSPVQFYDRGPWSRTEVMTSSLAISTRVYPSGVDVRVTEVATGKAVRESPVDVYTEEGTLLGSGMTDEKGLCQIKIESREEPSVIVASRKGGEERTKFELLSWRNSVREDRKGSCRAEYLAKNDYLAFAWTERGIYRHGEKIFFHALVRDANGKGVANHDFTLEIIDPSGRVRATKILKSDELGAVSYDSFAVDQDAPGGYWTYNLRRDGAYGVIVGSRKVNIEEFAPPQIRAKVDSSIATNLEEFAFKLSAEHLYGGPAKGLTCTGAVLFEDCEFTSEQWENWSFGDDRDMIRDGYFKLGKYILDDNGECVLDAGFDMDMRPKARVKVTAEGTVFEDGGRASNVRTSRVFDYYPYYLGSNLQDWVAADANGKCVVSIVAVTSDGDIAHDIGALEAIIEEPQSHKVLARLPVKPFDAQGIAEVELPELAKGDYRLIVSDDENEVCFSREFYFSSYGNVLRRTSAKNLKEVKIELDKKFYRPGETPELIVRSPFAGEAMLSVIRDDLIYTEIITLANATEKISLKACEASWYPNVDVRLQVIEQVEELATGYAQRAYGSAILPVRLSEREIPVELETRHEDKRVIVKLDAPGAKKAVVTVVDEGINLLTNEPYLNPISFFATSRKSRQIDFYDMYQGLSPVIKTGGDVAESLFGRVSPVPTRRFKPLALWQSEVELKDGKSEIAFDVGEFVGEVRVTAIAYSETAEGAKAKHLKVVPKIVAEPDAPRFVAPKDVFDATLPIVNCAMEEAKVKYSIVFGEKTIAAGEVELKSGEKRVISAAVHALDIPGEMKLDYHVEGLGEIHDKEILLPVRPASPWHEESGVVRLDGDTQYAPPELKPGEKFFFSETDSKSSELKDAYDWLAGYSHGCLEQTTSKCFPLLKQKEHFEYVQAGVDRVMSMFRWGSFVMWPDCDYEPWDKEVALYASQFLVEAHNEGAEIDSYRYGQILAYVSNDVRSFDGNIAAYACSILASAERPDKDRMLSLYEGRTILNSLAKIRLAKAYALTGDKEKASELMRGVENPSTVKEAAFALMTLLDLDPTDARIAKFVSIITNKRVSARYSWGTTEENALALLALSKYYEAFPVVDNARYIAWHRLSLIDAESLTEEVRGIKLERSFYDADGKAYDLANAHPGDLVYVELTLSSETSRDYNDLVIEDLFAGAMEPIHSGDVELPDWVMRYDIRDDRMLVFSKRFTLKSAFPVKFRYPLRVVSKGEYVLPSASLEAMYDPTVGARVAAGRIVSHD